ncbi:MAG: hypothetical protein WBB48_04940, partial [Thermodesulfobacteriota bacterium]
GFQAAALKPADFFGDDDILYLMEDAATGEIRLSILWEWLHKGGKINEADKETKVKAGDTFTVELFERLLEEEYKKLLKAKDKDVHDDSKPTTLPIAKEIVKAYVLDEVKTPWYIDLLNININNHDLATAKERIANYMDKFRKDGTRITENLDFVPEEGIDTSLEDEMDDFEREVHETKQYFASPRFKGVARLYSARQVVQQRGTLDTDYTVARFYSEQFFNR